MTMISPHEKEFITLNVCFQMFGSGGVFLVEWLVLKRQREMKDKIFDLS